MIQCGQHADCLRRLIVAFCRLPKMYKSATRRQSDWCPWLGYLRMASELLSIDTLTVGCGDMASVG